MSYDGNVKIGTKMDNTGIFKGFSDIKKKADKLETVFINTNRAIKDQERTVADLAKKMEIAANKAEKLKASGDIRGFEKAEREADRISDAFFKAETTLTKMQEKASQIHTELSSLRNEGLFNFVGQANDARENIAAFEHEIGRLKEALGKEQDPATFKALQHELLATQQEYEKFINGLSKPITNIMQIQDLQAQLEATKNKISELEYLMRLAKADGDVFGMVKLGNDLRKAKNEVGYLSAELSNMKSADIGISSDGIDQTVRKVGILKSAFTGIGSAARVGGRTALNAIKALSNGILRGTRIIARFAKGLLIAVKNTLMLGNSGRRASGGIQNLGKRIVQLGMAALVFNVLRRGMRALAQDLRTIMMQNTEFAASWNAIKVNLLTAFAPIWEVIQPALIVFMNVLAQVTGYLARFMALLFGKTVTEARAGAKALNAQAKGIEAVGSAAGQAQKDADGFLGTFDSINKAASDNAGGGGSGSGGGPGGGGGLDFNIEEPPSIAWLDELAEKLKTIFNIADPEYWRGLGGFLSDNITDTLMSIPWGRIQNGSAIFAENLGSFLNGALVNDDMWNAIGHTVAQGMNTALIFLNTLGDTFDFSGLGGSIAVGANTWFEEFDFKLLGGTIGTWVKGLYDTITEFASDFNWGNIITGAHDVVEGFIDSVDWADAGTRFSNAFSNIFSTLGEGITEVNWSELGKKLFRLIYDFITNIDFIQIMSDFWGFVGRALIGAIFLIAGFIKEAIVTIVDKFKAFWTEHDGNWGEMGRSIITGLFEGIKNAIAGIKQWLLTNIVEPFMKGIKELFGIASPSTKMAEIGNWIMQGLFNGIRAMFESVVNFFKELWDNIVDVFSVVSQFFSDKFSDAWEGIKRVWDAVVGWFQNIWDNIVRIFIVVNTWFADKFREAWLGIQNIWNAVVGWFRGIWNGIVGVFASAHTWFTDKFRAAWTGIKGVWDGAKQYFEGVWNNIKAVFSVVSDWFRDTFTRAWQNVKDVFSTGGAIFMGIVDGILNGLKSVINAIIDGMNRVVAVPFNGLNTALKTLRDMEILGLKPFGWIAEITVPQIPRLAKGGIVDGATVAEIGEKGREAVLPLDNNTGWMTDLAKELKELMNEGQQRSQQVEIVLEVDRREFGRAVVDLGDTERTRRGVRIQARAVTSS